MVQIPFHYREKEIFRNGRLPTLLYAGQIGDDPNWHFPSHKHDDLCEIIYVSEGSGNFTIDGRRFSARKGDILIYNRGVLHEERSVPDDPLKTYFCGVGRLQLEELEEGCLIHPSAAPVIPTGPYCRQIEHHISSLFEELHAQVYGFEAVCKHTLITLIITIVRIVRSQSQPETALSAHSLSAKIKDFIDVNYTRDIPLPEIANRLYISPDYLSHIFKEETGYSPINYMIRRRIGEAKKLLLTSDKPIQEIAELVGYRNANYFSTLFKKVAGESPSACRKNGLGAHSKP